MSRQIDFTDEELALMVEALDDASFYRDARSRAVDRGVRKRDRGLIPTSSDIGGHREKVRGYMALASRLKKVREGG